MTSPEPFPPYTAAAIDALAEAIASEPDFCDWLSRMLAYAAARHGTLDALTERRRGSWEAALVDRLARGLVIDDEGLSWYAEDERRRRGGGGDGWA